ncbi:reverse transcriptase domain-containing protein [Tanacetum coccineum]
MNGSSCVDGSGAGLILTSPEGTKFTYALRFQFTASNNKAECEALIAGLQIAAQMGVRNVHGIDIAGPFPEGPGKVKYGLFYEVDRDEIRGNNHRDNPFKDWCEKLNITQRFALVKHLQSNGLVERANMSLEVVIHAEVRMPTYRTAVVDVVHNDEELRLNLDLLEERRERAAIREAKAKLKMTKGKLSPKWEGPYDVTEALRDGAGRLRSMDETVLPRTWNIANLKKCYL